MDVAEFKSRKQVSPEQLDILIEYLKEHQELARGLNRGRRGRLNTSKLWNQCAKKLNSIKDGAVKDRKGWSKYWCDWKYRIKRRYLEQKVAKERNIPLPEGFISLTSLEEDILSIIGDSAIDEVIIKMDPLEDFENVNVVETVSIDNEVRSKTKSSKRNTSQDSDLDNPSGSNDKRKKIEDSEHFDHENEAAQFISLEKRKLENSNDIKNSLQAIVSQLTRLTDVMTDIRDVIANKSNL